jgi:hypothetical protein
MEQAGGINEIYNCYVGWTLDNSYAKAASAFSARLNYAYGVDYRSYSAINSISGISQATANAYIALGAQAALRVGATWGCTPGALTAAAIATYASHVNVAKETTNQRITAVKSNKYAQYQQYQAWLAEQARIAAERTALEAKLRAYGNNYLGYLRIKYNIPSPYNNDYVLENYGSASNFSEFQNLSKTTSSPFYGGSSYIPNLSIKTPPTSVPAPEPLKTQKAQPLGGYSLSDIGHLILDLAGLIPGFGEFADGANALWYLIEGDWTNMGLSAGGAIPIFGWASTGAKLGIKGVKAVGGEAVETGIKTEKVTGVIGSGSTLPPGNSQLQHIFRDAPGHVADTPANRTLLESTAQNPGNYVGMYNGNKVYARTQSDGTQVWVYERNGVIQNGGVNTTPWTPEQLLGGK